MTSRLLPSLPVVLLVAALVQSCAPKPKPAPGPTATQAPDYTAGSAEPMTVPKNAPKLAWSSADKPMAGQSVQTIVSLKVNGSTFVVGSHTGKTGGITPLRISSAPSFIPRTALACAQGNSNHGPIYYYVGSESEGYLTVYQFVTNLGTGKPAEQRFLKMIEF